ncbi:MAG: right-handed parallel beta-helix repeat-containing protein, partial [Polyangiaceae bacterium]
MRHARWCALGKAGALVAFVAPLLVARVARAADIDATPATLATAITQAQPGDTVHLTAGHYAPFSIANKNGTAKAWITISGPAGAAGTPPTAIVDANTACGCNTIEITGSSYVAIENLLVDGHNLDGVFGLSAKGSSVVHDIRVEGNTFVNHHGSQQHDAISTKIPTWGWIIRNNVIKDAGTGIYLGNSDGTDPFIGGLIEGNVVEDPIGYCMEIKYQKPRPTVAGMPTGPTTTIIRHNVFIKNDDPSPDGDRPNVLVGVFPASGAGAQDRYEVYGNIFVHNPRESLFQASGRVTIHDNIFVDAPTQHALTLQDHDLPLELATVYNNTMYDVGTGIFFGN